MTDEELREKIKEAVPHFKYGWNADRIITLITKEKAGEIFDRCVEAVVKANITRNMDRQSLKPRGIGHREGIDTAIEAIEQERKRYENLS